MKILKISIVFRSLLSRTSEKNKSGNVNSKKLLKKVNYIIDAQQLQTKIRRTKNVIFKLLNLELISNEELLAIKKEKKKKKKRKTKVPFYLDPKQLMKILSRDEDGSLDFKRTYLNQEGKFGKKEKVEFAKDVSSFANRSGGMIVIGIEDTGKIVGIRGNEPTRETLRQTLSKRIRPTIPVLDILDTEFQKKQLRITKIEESYRKPHEIEIGGTAKVYMRDGEISREATPREIVEMANRAKMIEKN